VLCQVWVQRQDLHPYLSNNNNHGRLQLIQ
jgi:hypothetical protein